MSPFVRLAGVALSGCLVLGVLSGIAVAAADGPGSGNPAIEDQKPGGRPGGAPPRAGPPEPPHPAHQPPARIVRGRVFVGGYFYDPVFGPYPWWRWPDYPYRYYPVYDDRAQLHIKVTPNAAKVAAVFVDGFYAGIVDDFDGVFQDLPLPPGGHSIVLYLEGYQTVRRNLYLPPRSSYTLREAMLLLPPGERSMSPDMAPALPPPPAGSYSLPPTPPALPAPPAPAATTAQAPGYGTLDLYVQPSGAEVTIDGQRWVSSAAGHFVVQLSVGTHRIEASRPGHRPYAGDVVIRDGEQTPLNVSLSATP
ncbi:MAG: PEGA domain-containing protein [Acidobacteria bacterium]|nr:PEGA domain-containing protein [Acidobacteriota bacterium]